MALECWVIANFNTFSLVFYEVDADSENIENARVEVAQLSNSRNCVCLSHKTFGSSNGWNSEKYFYARHFRWC